MTDKEQLMPEEIDEEGYTKPSMFQTLGAIIAGILAVKIATYMVTTLWRLVTREDPPQADDYAPLAKKAAWIGLVGGITGAARQAARDLIKPAGTPPTKR